MIGPERCTCRWIAYQTIPAFAALLVLIALTTPPKLRRWRLTGQHRLVHAIHKASQEYVQVG